MVNKEIPSSERLDRIEKKRTEAVSPEKIDEGVRADAEILAKQIYELRAQIKHLHDEIWKTVPQQAEVQDSDGQPKKRETTWQDVSLWLKDGQLENYFSEEIKMSFADKPERNRRIIAKQKVKEVQKALALKEQLEELEGAAKIQEPDKLSDEQKMARMFHSFRLRELAESRVKRSSVEHNLEETRNDIDVARQEGCWDVMDDLKGSEQGLVSELRTEVHSSPEAYYDYWGQQLLEAQRTFTESGRIYETKSVKAKTSKIASMLDQGQAVFIHGETGTGKTEIAKYIAKEHFGKDALIISGRRSLEFSEMTETQDIHAAVQKLPEEQRSEIMKRIQAIVDDPEYQTQIKEWADFRGKDAKKVRQEEIDRLEAGYLEYFKNPVEITSKIQPIYQAAKEGRAVIIDEMNAIPHHTLIALNDLLTRQTVSEEIYNQYQERIKKGESAEEIIKALNINEHNLVRPIYGHEPIVMAPGFCVMATGNWKPEDGASYVGRQTLDTAFLRRFGVIDYDYLPNPTEGELNDPNIDPEIERAQKEQAELYRMLCARMINPDLTAEVPENSFEQLDKLAQVAKIIQDGFSGKKMPDGFEAESLTGTRGKLRIEEVLRENVLDLGKMVQYVIEPWKKDNFQYPLEAYLFDRYISRSSARPVEMVFLYKAFQLRGFFNSGEGWPEIIDLASSTTTEPNGTLNAADLKRLHGQRIQQVLEFSKHLEQTLYKHPDIEYEESALLEFKENPRKFFAPTEVIDSVVGRPPERTRFPDLAKALKAEGETTETVELSPAEQERRTEIRQEVDEFEAKLTQRLEVWENTQLEEELKATLGGEADYCRKMLQMTEELKQLLNNPATTPDEIQAKYEALHSAAGES